MAGNLNVGSINDVGFMPINLAINPEFTINQRGAASPTAATGYNYDRWYYDGSSLLQGIENLNLRATTYVVSWEGSATCSYSLNTAASSSQGGQTYTSITNGGTLTIASVGSNNLWIKFSGTLTGLTKVSVVPSGTKSPFLPRQYQQELALCQRYYEKSYNTDVIPSTSTNNGVERFMSPRTATIGAPDFTASIRFKTKKRSAPTITIYSATGASGKVRDASAGADVSATTGEASDAAFGANFFISDSHLYSWHWVASAEL